MNNNIVKHRVKWAGVILPRYLELVDWEIIRFSDKVHFSYRFQNNLRIIRKPGERYYADYL